MIKKLTKIILLLLMIVSWKNIQALSYKMKELIPIHSTITMTTSHFSYKNMQFNKDTITFTGIKNLSEDDSPISISIGLFGKNKKNIGTVYICDTNKILKHKEEQEYTIHNISEYLMAKKTTKDIYYLSILSENKGCRTAGSKDYIGQKVEEIGKINKNTISDDIIIFNKVLIVVGLIIIIPIIYKAFFTSSLKNIDGNAVRNDYKNWQEIKKDKEPKIIKKPIAYKEFKTKEIRKQEKEAREEEKNDTALHNLYK